MSKYQIGDRVEGSLNAAPATIEKILDGGKCLVRWDFSGPHPSVTEELESEMDPIGTWENFSQAWEKFLENPKI